MDDMEFLVQENRMNSHVYLLLILPPTERTVSIDVKIELP